MNGGSGQELSGARWGITGWATGPTKRDDWSSMERKTTEPTGPNATLAPYLSAEEISGAIHKGELLNMEAYIESDGETIFSLLNLNQIGEPATLEIQPVSGKPITLWFDSSFDIKELCRHLTEFVEDVEGGKFGREIESATRVVCLSTDEHKSYSST
jgi:hypothetical protein